jgi:hypothetical protein
MHPAHWLCSEQRRLSLFGDSLLLQRTSCFEADQHFFTLAAVEHEDVPVTLHPLLSQAFRSLKVSLPEGDGHCWQELPLPQRKQRPGFAVTLSEFSEKIMKEKERTNAKKTIFFI